MYQHQINIRVRYAETDQMGFVYYGNYATYYEVARVECLRAIGIRYKDLENEGILLPVVENRSKFLKAATYDELLQITVYIHEIPSKKIKFDYEIKNEKKELIHTGTTILLFFDKITQKVVQCPEKILSQLQAYFY